MRTNLCCVVLLQSTAFVAILAQEWWYRGSKRAICLQVIWVALSIQQCRRVVSNWTAFIYFFWTFWRIQKNCFQKKSWREQHSFTKSCFNTVLTWYFGLTMTVYQRNCGGKLVILPFHYQSKLLLLKFFYQASNKPRELLSGILCQHIFMPFLPVRAASFDRRILFRLMDLPSSID